MGPTEKACLAFIKEWGAPAIGPMQQAVGCDRETLYKVLGKLMYDRKITPLSPKQSYGVFWKLAEEKGNNVWEIRRRYGHSPETPQRAGTPSTAVPVEVQIHAKMVYGRHGYDVNELAEVSGFAKDTVRRAMKVLEKQGLVQRSSAPSEGRGRPKDLWVRGGTEVVDDYDEDEELTEEDDVLEEVYDDLL